jgi:hypothetical protein
MLTDLPCKCLAANLRNAQHVPATEHRFLIMKHAGVRGRAAIYSTCAVFLLSLAAPNSPLAQDTADPYPSKPLCIIVGFAAGGGNDLFARLIGQKLSEQVGQPVIIENKPGAGGRLAVDYAAASGRLHACAWSERGDGRCRGHLSAPRL